MTKYFSVFILLCFTFVAQAQVSEKFKPFGFKDADGYKYLEGFELKAKIKGLPDKKVYLTAVRGGESLLIDSIVSNNGYIEFWNKNSPLRGMYRVILDQEKYFEIILSNELTQVTTSYESPMEDLVVTYSRENRCYYYYINKMIAFERPLAALYESPNIDQEFLGHFTDSIIREKNFYSKELAWNFSETFAAKLIRSLKIPERADFKPADVMKFEDRMSFMKEYAFSNINFGDSELLRSDIFYYSIKYYLDNLVQPQDEENYIKACDKIMALAYKNKNVYDYILKLLMNAFTEIRMDVVYTHLAERYMLNDEECTTVDTSKRSIKDRVTLLKKTDIGIVTPSLNLPDKKGKNIDLMKMNANGVLILFWSTHCKHCKKSFPEIEKIYNQYKKQGLVIYAVNIDSLKSEWKTALQVIKTDWVHTIATEGIDNPQLVNYSIRATPKMILIDKDKKIVAKPKNTVELAVEVGKLLK
ncbi:MAG: redoxin domain-containing protein [Bacteroidota bacterium]